MGWGDNRGLSTLVYTVWIYAFAGYGWHSLQVRLSTFHAQSVIVLQ